MQNYDYLIIGGGIAGTTAAESIRVANSGASVAILENERHLLYSRVFLPSYVTGKTPREKVMLRTLADYEKKRIDIYLETSVARIDFLKREVLSGPDRKFSYKKLLIASGGKVCPWVFEREFGDKIVRLQSLDDADRISDLIRKGAIKRVLVVGGGFIAAEFLNIFDKLGAKITLLFKDEYFWQGRVDGSMRTFIDECFSKNKIEVLARDEILSLKRKDGGIEAATKNGKTVYADLIGAGLGLERNLDVAYGILDTGRGIKADEYLKASYLEGQRGEDVVWAAGDVMEYFDVFSRNWRTIGNWTQAFMTGHLAGVNMTGGQKSFHSISSYSIKLLGNSAVFLGDNDAENLDRIISYAREDEQKYARFSLRGGKLIGAVLFNAKEYRPQFTGLIESAREVSADDLRF